MSPCPPKKRQIRHHYIVHLHSGPKLKAGSEVSNTGNGPVDENKCDGCHWKNLSSQKSQKATSPFKPLLSVRRW